MYGFSGLLNYNVIEPTAFRGLNPEGADYTGFIITKKEIECLRLFLNYLLEDKSWDFIYLMGTPGFSSIQNLLSQISNLTSLKFNTVKGAICPYILLPSSIDNLMLTLNRNFRKALRRNMRCLQDNSQKMELKKYDEVGSVEETMKIFFKLHQKRCKSKALPGVFAKQEICDFYVDVARLFADNRWLGLYFLTLDDEPIASQYCFEYNNKMYSALAGFDPNYSTYGVGNIITFKIAENCIKRGLEEYDLLKGDEAWKFHWSSRYRTNLGIRFVNKKVTSNLYDLGIRTIKKLKINQLLEKDVTYR